MDRLQTSAGVPDRARLRDAAAPRAGAWLGAPPNKILGSKITNAEIHSRVGRRLGAEITQDGPCPFCFGVIDRYGIHPECCTAGGDKTAGHNDIRNGIYVNSGRGSLQPVLEAKGVLSVLRVAETGVGQGDRRRPADVLLCRACDVQTGSRGRGNPKVALEVGVVCPQAQGHMPVAAAETLGAAEVYVR